MEELMEDVEQIINVYRLSIEREKSTIITRSQTIRIIIIN